jgi:hypothetical protein
VRALSQDDPSLARDSISFGFTAEKGSACTSPLPATLKLLLVLTEHSISNPWVEEEVEAALERERRDGRSVLFPIRLDDAVMESSTAWAASLRRMRHIGDFRQWEHHVAYSKAFARLMRDLQNDASIPTVAH